MVIINKFLKACRNPYKILIKLINLSPVIYKNVPDKIYLGILYKSIFRKKINWDNPKTFNEKLQWLKLYDRKPIYTTLVDKYSVKKYVADKIGEQYIIPTLGVWDKFDDINFDKLPNQFVLKCTHDSGGLAICRDKTKFDVESAKKKIEQSLKRNYFWPGREWPYKNVCPRIIAEKYICDASKEDLPDFKLMWLHSDIDKSDNLNDYKFYCFNGAVKFVMVNTDRNSTTPTKADYFDSNYKWLDFKWGYDHANTPPPKPSKFNEMISIAEKLSKGIPHVRVDLYECHDCIYFGELTFFDGGGFEKFTPEKWDEKVGSLIELPANVQL